MKLSILLIFGLMAIYSTEALMGNATWYNLGLTACGKWYNNQDYVAAIGWPYWSHPNPNLDPTCEKMAILINWRTGLNATVKIQDICGSCGMNNIDLSPAVFQALGENLATGMFLIDWSYIN